VCLYWIADVNYRLVDILSVESNTVDALA
jgi:hypothetical protein